MDENKKAKNILFSLFDHPAKCVYSIQSAKLAGHGTLELCADKGTTNVSLFCLLACEKLLHQPFGPRLQPRFIRP